VSTPKRRIVALALTKVSPSTIRLTGISGQSEQQIVVEQSEMSRVGSKGPTSIVKGVGVIVGAALLQARTVASIATITTSQVVCRILGITGP
jgi:hypothetical protein